MEDMRQPRPAFPNVSGRWLLSAAAIVILGAAACGWLVLCLLYWQGSWQLLYHPKATITRTPASVGLAFENIKFAANETGQTQLTGWWIPAAKARFTVLYLHGADGNLSDSVDALAALRRNELSVFAIDYRGYGQSQIADQRMHPGERQLRQDAEWALTWLTVNRGIAAKSIVVFGSGLGANIAAELAADHAELAGAVFDQLIRDVMEPIFNDSRSKLVPAHAMNTDRYDVQMTLAALRIPSLWLFAKRAKGAADVAPQFAPHLAVQETNAWLQPPVTADPYFDETLRRWLDDLP